MRKYDETISGGSCMSSAASIKDRLKNQSAKSGKSFQELLITYALERTIYRLSISKYADRFTLKGGIFLYAIFGGEYARTTRDIDFLARNMSNSTEDIRKVFKDIFLISCDDALQYDLNTLKVENITEFKDYHGVNVSVTALIEKTKIPVSIDIGYDDVIYPDREKMEFPVLLDMENPKVYAYSIYSSISEKFEAIVSLGDANSRYKDFYDIYMLASKYDLNGAYLKKALIETFEHRGTSFDDIFAFTNDFVSSEIHQNRWKFFLKRKQAMVDVELDNVIHVLKDLLLPIVKAIINKNEFNSTWDYRKLCWK